MPEDSRRARLVSLPLWVYRHRVPILAALGGVLLLGLVVLASFTTRVVQRFEGRRWNLPSRIYSDLYQVRAGETAAIGTLTAKLERLYYQRVDGEPDRPGHFRLEKDAVEIHTRPFRYPGRLFPDLRARVVFSKDRVKAITAAGGDPLPALVLEPELLGSVFSAELEDRTVILQPQEVLVGA